MLRVVGYWPTPELVPAEVLVWTDELTNPRLGITLDEALTELTAMSRAGTPFRPRVGQLVIAAVRATRRSKVPTALPPAEPECAPAVGPGQLGPVRGRRPT